MNRSETPHFRVVLIVPQSGRKADHLKRFFRKYPDMREHALFRVLTPTADIFKHVNRRYKKVYFFQSVEQQIQRGQIKSYLQRAFPGGDCISVNC